MRYVWGGVILVLLLSIAALVLAVLRYQGKLKLSGFGEPNASVITTPTEIDTQLVEWKAEYNKLCNNLASSTNEFFTCSTMSLQNEAERHAKFVKHRFNKPWTKCLWVERDLAEKEYTINVPADLPMDSEGYARVFVVASHGRTAVQHVTSGVWFPSVQTAVPLRDHYLTGYVYSVFESREKNFYRQLHVGNTRLGYIMDIRVPPGGTITFRTVLTRDEPYINPFYFSLHGNPSKPGRPTTSRQI